MVTDKNERQVKTGNGLLRFCMNVVGAALVCTGVGICLDCIMDTEIIVSACLSVYLL